MKASARFPIRSAPGSAVAAALLACAWSASSVADAPPDAFAGAMRIDGVPTSVNAFESPGSPDDLARAYAATWRRERPAEPVVESTVGRWRVVGQRTGTRYRTAQFEALEDGRTRAVVADRELVRHTPAPRPPLALPPASRVLRTIESRDGDRRALQVVAHVPAEPGAVARRLRAAAEGESWRQAHSTSGRAGDASAWERDGEELLVVVTPAPNGASVLMHVAGAAAGGAR